MPENHQSRELGKKGERAAEAYLIYSGFSVLQRNYRCGRSEIDLIVANEDLMVFVEVKTRSNNDFGHPEDFVTDHQKNMILKASAHYVSEKDWKHNVRFDIIAINVETNELAHFEDAFY
ncbi:MAG TPA: YraN family protein [Cyclobacteriaceae bacterium]